LKTVSLHIIFNDLTEIRRTGVKVEDDFKIGDPLKELAEYKCEEIKGYAVVILNEGEK